MDVCHFCGRQIFEGERERVKGISYPQVLFFIIIEPRSLKFGMHM